MLARSAPRLRVGCFRVLLVAAVVACKREPPASPGGAAPVQSVLSEPAHGESGVSPAPVVGSATALGIRAVRTPFYSLSIPATWRVRTIVDDRYAGEVFREAYGDRDGYWFQVTVDPPGSDVGMPDAFWGCVYVSADDRIDIVREDAPCRRPPEDDFETADEERPDAVPAEGCLPIEGGVDFSTDILRVGDHVFEFTFGHLKRSKELDLQVFRDVLRTFRTREADAGAKKQ